MATEYQTENVRIDFGKHKGMKLVIVEGEEFPVLKTIMR